VSVWKHRRGKGARDPSVEPARRDAMAKARGHPQLQAVAHKHMNADGTPIAPTGASADVGWAEGRRYGSVGRMIPY
jgi:hypothetical protein